MLAEYKYSQYLKSVMFLLTASLSQEQIANLPSDVLSHIGGGWKRKCEPRQIAALIISDIRYAEVDIYDRRLWKTATEGNSNG